MTKYLYVSEEVNENGHYVLNYIKITNKTVREYFKFSGSPNLVCVGDHWLKSSYHNLEELKDRLSWWYDEIDKEYILEY